MTLHTWTDEELPQGSDEWLQARCGVLTASTIGRLITVGTIGAVGYGCPDCGAEVDQPCMSKASKTPKPISTFHSARHDVAAEVGATSLSIARGDTARDLTLSLASERITGHVEPVFVNADMQRGHDEEPLARDLYAEHHKVSVDQVGFMVEDKWGFKIGFSPDGLVGDDGLFETKSRRQKKQVRTILAGEVPPENFAQLQCGLLVSGRKWIDFGSYSNGMHFWTKRVYPDPAWQEVLVAAAAQLEADIAEIVTRYEAATSGLPVAEYIPEFNDLEF